MTVPFVPRPEITLADAALAAIGERHVRLLDARQRFLLGTDPDALHDVRVALRRLRAARRLFRPDIRLPRALRDRVLRRLGRRLAALRDTDIALGAVRQASARIGPHAKALTARLEKRRERLAERARQRLEGERVGRILAALDRWESAPRFRVEPEATVHDALPARMAEAVGALLEDPAWALELEQDRTGALRDEGSDRSAHAIGLLLHRLRRRAKRVRYQLEIAAPLLGWDEREAVAALVEMQDALGELQDVRVIEAWRDALPDERRPWEEFDEWLVGRRQAALQRWRVVRRERLAPVTAVVAPAPA